MKRILLLILLFIAGLSGIKAQTIRYQQSVRGGLTYAANALVLTTSSFANTGGGVLCSSYSDLILPAGSSIAKAILYVENHTGGTPITAVKFKVGGSSAFANLTSLMPGFIANPANSDYSQFIYDVTPLMPASGYVSTYTAGGNAANTGRYTVADPTVSSGAPTVGNGWGWTLYVVYTNPASKYRNVTIADGCNPLVPLSPISFTVNNITVPSTGTYNAVVGVTGTWGEDGLTYTDNLKLGPAGGTLVALRDPVTGATNNALNGTIGMGNLNNVSSDGGPAISGSYQARNPYNTFGTGTALSLYYDADIFNANGSLPNSATPINVTFQQEATASDALGTGAYAISIDVASSCMTKSVAPVAIAPGGVATYTFTITNIASGAINLSGIGFTDNLPSALVVANPTGASLSGGTGGTVLATAGGNSVSLSGLNLGIGQTATMTVCVTNAPGSTAGDCTTNPSAYTNSQLNIVNSTPNLVFCGNPVCLTVSAAVSAELVSFKAVELAAKMILNWTTGNEKDLSSFIIERSKDGLNYEQISSVKAQGSSSSGHKYSYTDISAEKGLNYYRLRMQNNNGSSSYSSMTSARLVSTSSQLLNSYCCNGELLLCTIHAELEGNYVLQVLDVNGRLYKSETINIKQTGTLTHELSTAEMKAGLYLLQIQAPDGTLHRSKVLKKE